MPSRGKLHTHTIDFGVMLPDWSKSSILPPSGFVLSIVPSSYPWPCSVKSQLVSLSPVGILSKYLKRESTRSLSNQWTTMYQHDLTCITNFYATVLTFFLKEIISNNTKCRKQVLKFIWNTWKYWWNEADEEF